MFLFESDFFDIAYLQEADTMQGIWKDCRLSEEYMNAIKQFKVFYEKIKPASTLWNQTDFHYPMTDEERSWTDIFLNVPAMQLGCTTKIALVLGSDMLAALSVMELFEQGKASLMPQFFAHEQPALQWIEKKESRQENPSVPKAGWLVEKLEDQRKARISLEVDIDELPDYLVEFKRLLSNRKFIAGHYSRYRLLTPREKIILALVTRGFSNAGIADLLSISYDTVKTHRKHILQKLECKNVANLMAYRVFFL